MEAVKIGIIGFGGMAGYHARHMRKSGLMEPIGVYDICPESLANAEKAGLKIYGTYEDLLGDESLEAVLIATPNDWHPFYAMACARAGKAVICEKPAACSSEEFMEMAEEAEACGTLLMVHQNRRWDDDYLTVKNIYDKNLLGPIGRIESRVQGANGIPGGWRKSHYQGGGMMLDWGVHMIDQVMQMMKEELKTVYCQYSYEQGFKVDDAFKLELGFAGNKFVEIVVDTNCYVPLPRWMAYGLDGTAIVEDWDLNGRMVKPVYSDKPYELNGIQAGNGFTKTMAYRPHDSVSTLPLEIVNRPAFPFYSHFVKALRGEEEPVVKNSEVLRVLRIMEAAKKSSDTGETIRADF